MLKKLGVAALLLGSVGMALAPASAYAEDRFDGRGRYHDGDWDRHERREWREQERWEARRAEEWREAQWRAREWRQREWREREYGPRPYYPAYQPGASLYFGYGR